MNADHRMLARKAQLINALEHMCQSLEPTEAQLALAKDRYEGVGAWLAAADNPLLRALSIYLQGSTALSTMVRPIRHNEHDVDLVAYMRNLGLLPPTTVKKAIGDRLRENGHYRPLLEEKPRCWRLCYANEFHMDITPSIPNPDCLNGGELVPDKMLSAWKASNPKGYKALFERRAAMQPRMRLVEAAIAAKSTRADVEPYPSEMGLKGILRRTVQIAKRHRDIYFIGHDQNLAPISVILTTLASRSYEYCVTRFVYDSELDLVRDVIRHMPAFIDTRCLDGRHQWFIWNETTDGENFAEKWNKEPSRAEAFFAWHRRAMEDLDRIAGAEGLDKLTKNLSESFGQGPATAALGALTSAISTTRHAGRLTVAPIVGLGAGAAAATPVRANTFFGAR